MHGKFGASFDLYIQSSRTALHEISCFEIQTALQGHRIICLHCLYLLLEAVQLKIHQDQQNHSDGLRDMLQ
ncbi:hypothetical protein N657DRAFT_386188 [Parathielavia appendiculata]|uniref:Uncharacterized protein n=1 Tax=Parathielavia appendiculata TaxID=2587402 RepID=A0AAN6Z437_9PEZI|nr:hypothetical protein N657DRAFT_386188 [Parathielavia appendiculata]